MWNVDAKCPGVGSYHYQGTENEEGGQNFAKTCGCHSWMAPKSKCNCKCNNKYIEYLFTFMVRQ